MADEELIEVFRVTNPMAGRAAIDEVLMPIGIDAIVHDRVSHMIPAPASLQGSYFLAVPLSQARKAIDALQEALTDGAIDGEIIPYNERLSTT